jgi:hypothetical protein
LSATRYPQFVSISWLRLEALGDAVTAWEEKFAPLIGSEVADADKVLDRAAKKRRRGAA